MKRKDEGRDKRKEEKGLEGKKEYERGRKKKEEGCGTRIMFKEMGKEGEDSESDKKKEEEAIRIR